MKIDLSSWKMRDMSAWSTLLQTANYEGITQIVIPVLKEWEKGEATVDALMDLSPKDWKAIITEVSVEVGKAFSA